MERSLRPENINKRKDSAGESNFGDIDIIKNEIGNGETEIVFVNKNEVEVDFNQEIQTVLNFIQTIQDKEKNTTDTNEIKGDMYELIETVDNLLRDKNNHSEFADEEYINISSNIISTTLSQLNNMSKKLVDDTNDCYSKDFLDKLENILCCFKEVIKNSTNSNQDQTYTNEIFGIMKNIMEQKKKLLLTAIENFQSNQQQKNLSLNSVLSNLMEANVKFMSVYNVDKNGFNFLKRFYGEVFDKLIPVLDKNNLDDNLKQYNISLIDTIFDGILRSSDKMLYNCQDNPAYTIGDLFIEKYYLQNHTDNKVDWRVPNLDRFISKYYYYDTYRKYDYYPIKVELMREKIKILENGQVENGNGEFNIDWGKKYSNTKRFVYGYFGFNPQEFFDLKNNSDEANTLRLNMGYIISLEGDLQHIWICCNKLFHEYKNKYENDPDSRDKCEQYPKIKKYRADIYNVFRELETEKQKLLKERLVNIIKSKFRPLSLFEKIFRLSLLIITFPIYASVFILVKTLSKFFHCFLLGLECIGKLLVFKCRDDCKDVWAKDCEQGNLDGLKINGKEISNRIRWYETKNWLFWRRILFPIDLAIHIIIGFILAIIKIFTSIIKVFVTAYRVGSDIICDDASSYIFKEEYGFEIICNRDSRISVVPCVDGHKIKARNKFIDMTCPRVPYCDFSNKPKSVWEHFLCLTGFKSIKSAEHYDEYAHEHSGTPRLNLLGL